MLEACACSVCAMLCGDSPMTVSTVNVGVLVLGIDMGLILRPLGTKQKSASPD